MGVELTLIIVSAGLLHISKSVDTRVRKSWMRNNVQSVNTPNNTSKWRRG